MRKNFEIADTLLNFQVIKKSCINEFKSEEYLFKNTINGAKVLYIPNDDDNKCFFIGFHTPPKDNSGVCHIIEHSVLCGSKKYDVKDLFNELSKGSLNTYLNAVTYNDRTVYPLASFNNSDFFNLMEVYLDCVFNPLIFDKQNIFMQEGWYYNIENENSEISINGIVYNEMKGAYSQAERILNNTITKKLFKNTTLEFDAGGNPEFIPNLSFGKMTEYYKKYYKPSNCYIYIYGNVDIEKCFNIINNSFYESNFSYSKRIVKPYKNIINKNSNSIRNNAVYSEKYSVVSENNIDNKYYFSLAYPCMKSTDLIKSAGMEILNYILCGNNEAPVKKAIISNGISNEFFSSYSVSNINTYIIFYAKNANKLRFGDFQNVMKNTIYDLYTNGLSKDNITAALNRWEFDLIEQDYGARPKGLQYGLDTLGNWIYGADIKEMFEYRDIFYKIKSMSNDGFFERLIGSYLIRNKKIYAIISPSKGYDSQKENIEKQNLLNYKSSISKQELNKLIDDSKELKDYLNREDDINELLKIPVVNINDIERTAKKIDYTIEKNDMNYIITECKKDEIIYLNLIFDTSKLDVNQINVLNVLSNLLGKTNTENFSSNEIVNLVNTYIGNISFVNGTYSKYNDRNEYYSKLTVNSKFLYSNIDKYMKILTEIICLTKFDNYEKIKTVVSDIKGRFESQCVSNGHMKAITRSLSYISDNSCYIDNVFGLEFYDVLKNTDESICYDLKKTYEEVFSRNNFIVGISCNSKYLNEVKKRLTALNDQLFGNNKQIDSNLINNFSGKTFGDLKTKSLKERFGEGIIISSKVQHNVFAYNTFVEKEYLNYNGMLQVLRTALNGGYLWPKIRNMGGAYGCGCSFLKNGDVYFYSFRDPNLEKTINVFRQTAQYLRDINMSKRDLNKFIISAISSLDKPKTDEQILEAAQRNNICQISDENIAEERLQILDATFADFKKLGNVIDQYSGQSYICSFGYENAIMKMDDLLVRKL